MKAEVISNLIFNQQKGIVEVCVMTVPGMGNFTDMILEDLALITGAHIFQPNEEKELIDCEL